MRAWKNKLKFCAHEINENNVKLKGRRVEMTSTYGASGISAQTRATVSSLDKTELIMLDEE